MRSTHSATDASLAEEASCYFPVKATLTVCALVRLDLFMVSHSNYKAALFFRGIVVIIPLFLPRSLSFHTCQFFADNITLVLF